MKGKNLQLRAPEFDDIDLLYLWENDMEIWHLGNTLAPYSRQQIEQFVINYTQDIYQLRQLRFMIDLVKDGNRQTIGSIDLYDFDPHHRRAGVGILIHREFRRKGFASEALELLSDYCFNILEMHQIYCPIKSGNEESVALFRKCGFNHCGTRKDWFLVGGSYYDEILMQKLRNTSQSNPDLNERSEIRNS